MNRIHNDLGVAETLIHNLDSWLNKWNIETPRVHIDVQEKSTIVEKSEYPIVYARTQREKHLPGSLVVSNKTLDIFNAERSLVDISFPVREVTEVSVHTPWEVTISQLKIGQAGQTVHLIAARLVHILQTLEVLLPGKINYDDPPCDTGDQDDNELDVDRLTSAGRYKCMLGQNSYNDTCITQLKYQIKLVAVAYLGVGLDKSIPVTCILDPPLDNNN